MSFKPRTQLEQFISLWFESVDEFVLINKTLDAYLKEIAAIEIEKDKPCDQKMVALQDLMIITTHTELLLSGLKNSCMKRSTFANYAALHIEAIKPESFVTNNAELN